jgi:type I restriction enzyme S subunit
MSKIEFEFDIPAALPDGWKWMPLEELMDSPKQDIVDGPFGSNLKASEYVDEGIPIARLQNVDRNAFVHKNIKYVTRKKADGLSRHTFRPGDILITKLGDPLGEACIAPSSIEHGVIVADLVRVRPAEKKVDRRYLTYAINSPLVARQFEKHTKGTTRPRVNLGMIRQLPIPVAPRDMQAGVVAEIEKQFSRLDEAVANLKRVKANLKRYKAAVLKAAVEGRLVETEAEIARREGRSYETGEQLLQRILETRRSQWKGKGKYKEPAAPDITDLPELPEGWVWATMPQLGELNRGKSKHRPRDDKKLYGGPYPFIQTGDVRKSEGRITEYSQTYSEFGLKQSRLWPARTLCVTIAANIAETGILTFAACFPDSVVGFLIEDGATTTQYVEYFIRTAREKLERFAPATAQKNINLEVLEAVAVPLPPLAEQERIVSEIDRRLSLVREVETQVDANLKRGERMRQAVLSRAFSGFVPIENPRHINGMQ